MSRRTHRLNSLLREVITEVIQSEVKNPDVHPFTTVTEVDITPDLAHAKVFVSVIASKEEREATLRALQQAAGFIAVHASKRVTLRTFPALAFKLDESAEAQAHIESLLRQVEDERESRNPPSE